MFLTAYREGQPVFALKDGRPCSFVMGFVQFPDGVSWCDDSILNGQNPRPPYHHHYGKVEFDGAIARCDGLAFSPVEDESIAAQWDDLNTTPERERVRHERIERTLREERSL